MILLGDTHLGIKKFNKEILTNQLDYLYEVIDFAREESREIFQLGDLFDNRIFMDIDCLNKILRFFKENLKEVKFHTLLGNHDIYFRESLESNLSKILMDLYPENFIVYSKQQLVKFKEGNALIVPWLTKHDKIDLNLLAKADFVLGHFELNGFDVIKGIKHQSSNIDNSIFKKPVFSGHFHQRDLSHKFIKYLGTPYQLTWSDFDEVKGFYILKESLELEFFENYTSPRFLEIHYNSNLKECLKIYGLFDSYKGFENIPDFLQYSKSLTSCVLKFINFSEDNSYEDILFLLKDSGLNYTFINKQKLNELNRVETKNLNTKEIILEYFKENKEYINDVLELMREVETENF